MGRRPRATRSLIAGLALLAIAGCSNIDRRHGYTPDEETLSQIVVGVDTKETVADLVGQPTASGVLAESGWYYVASKFRAYGPLERQEIDRQVVAVSFAQDGTVQNIERFGLQDGRVIALSRRVTDSNIRGVSFLKQLFGSIGNFAADTLVGD